MALIKTILGIFVYLVTLIMIFSEFLMVQENFIKITLTLVFDDFQFFFVFFPPQNLFLPIPFERVSNLKRSKLTLRDIKRYQIFLNDRYRVP